MFEFEFLRDSLEVYETVLELFISLVSVNLKILATSPMVETVHSEQKVRCS